MEKPYKCVKGILAFKTDPKELAGFMGLKDKFFFDGEFTEEQKSFLQKAKQK